VRARGHAVVLIFRCTVAATEAAQAQTPGESNSRHGLVANSPDATSHACSSGEIQAGW
jgi:hypothetical protein